MHAARARRKGCLGLSGGIDSSVTAALAVRALGAERVFGLFMPEADSDPESSRWVVSWRHLGLRTELEDIALRWLHCGATNGAMTRWRG